jgi:O-antigen/teichoic acid export membrane protein
MLHGSVTSEHREHRREASVNATRALFARLLTLITGFACSILTARLILGTAGVENFALYSLLVALPALIPFTDLGTGAVLVNAYARSGDSAADDQMRQQTTTVARIMTGFALIALAANCSLYALGLWPRLLGSAASDDVAGPVAFFCASLFCLSIPFGIWTKVLLGLGRNHWIILVQGSQAPLVLLFVYIFLVADRPPLLPWVALAAYTAMLVVALLGFWLAHRATRGQLTADFAKVFRRSAPGARVMDVGWPMLVQTLTPPITNQATRFIVAQSVSVLAIAKYSVVLQILTPALGLVSAVGLTLWPYYARARAHGTAAVGPLRLSAIFAGAASLATISWVVVAPTLFDLMSAGKVDVDRSLVVCFGLQLITQAALYPLGMYLMSPGGIRFQVIPAVLMCFSTVILVLSLAPAMGVAVVPLAISSSTLLFQIAPFIYFIVRTKDSDRRVKRSTACLG